MEALNLPPPQRYSPLKGCQGSEQLPVISSTPQSSLPLNAEKPPAKRENEMFVLVLLRTWLFPERCFSACHRCISTRIDSSYLGYNRSNI